MKSESSIREKFWHLPLEELNELEWELLCDGCGRCCLKKIQDEESEEVFWTRVVCRYLDQSSCRCTEYKERSTMVPSCLDVRQVYQQNSNWMPATCAYRLRAEGKPLFHWHPLISESKEAMLADGITVTDKCLSEDNVHADGYQEHVIKWVES
ncbi:MAG: YcgN family cysteine cluster protein [Gammaproteobacteria bacterium]|nr:YcgN family cysteine cluster protein [Gammaproteobacteria bacterium]